MERLKLHIHDKNIFISPEKIVVATPCECRYQAEFISELQIYDSRIRLTNEQDELVHRAPPILLARQLMRLDGNELEQIFTWWQKELSLKNQNKVLIQGAVDWKHLSIDKKITLFAKAALAHSPLCYIFLEDIHLSEQEQKSVFDNLKHYVREFSSVAVVFWSYRTQIPHTQNLYFKGFL
jgi:hypothetical protein